MVDRARAAGWEVTATSRTRPGTRLDIRDAAAVDSLVGALRPHAVIHTAYVQRGPEARPTIVDGTAHVASAAVAAGARLVHVSTDVVFDGRAGRPYREDDPPSPLSPYGAAKAAAESVVVGLDPAAAVVRTSLLVGGPGGRPSPHEALAGDPGATFFHDELRCPAQVDDLAAALVELCDEPVAGVLHAGGADAVSRHELATLVAGRPVRAAAAPPGRPLDCRLDSSRARARLTTRLRGVRELYARPGRVPQPGGGGTTGAGAKAESREPG